MEKSKFKNLINENLSIKVNISTTGSNSLIDDIRFQPTDSEMTTYTYEPFNNVTSVSDLNNKALKYEYDNMGRLVIIRDFKDNILKKYTYKVIN